MLIDGQPRDSIDACDRGLHYGDGLFETVAVKQGRPLLWPGHMARLRQGCSRLGMAGPDPDVLERDALAEIAGRDQGVLKIILTRGCGGRGYRPPKASRESRILSFHSRPDYPLNNWTLGVKVRNCRTRLGMNPDLAGLKHLNRLEQVLARSEWDDATVAEGLMWNLAGNLVEGTMSNCFLVMGEELLTPSLDQCGVAGVMRQTVLDSARDLGIACKVTDIPATWLARSDALFLTNSLIGIWPVRQLDQRAYSTAAIPAALLERITPLALIPTLGHA